MAQYGKIEYWNERYTRDTEPFEWFQRWSGIRDIVTATVPDKKSHILVVGCGNSRISEEMFDEGYTNQINIDASMVVIEACKERYDSKKGLNYEVLDVTHMQRFQSGTFDAVIDKALLDSILCGDSGTDMAGNMLKEIQRVLRPNGVYICVSYGKQLYRMPYLAGENEDIWTIETKTIPKPRLVQGAVDLPDSEGHHYVYICKKKDVTTNVCG
eukprot:GHVO01010322.1.p1 GENE.GHVO01010322.1~~GHVO01010322.1.p1  ORF type:complete len:222 (+),score=31.93 GHVO01010322.1:29-667(+)